MSRPHVSRIERGQVSAVSIIHLARLLSVVGLDLSARAYPSGGPIRDAAQIALLDRFRASIPARIGWRTEVAVGGPGDLRAWDAVLIDRSMRVGVEAETRLTDVQAVERRIGLKCRDSGIPVAILVLADTRTNRLAVPSAESVVRAFFPLPGIEAVRALKAGALPTVNALIFS